MKEIKLTNRVYLTPCKQYTKESVAEVLVPMLERILDDNGFFGDFTGKKVVIKPNLLLKREPGAGVTTHPTFLEVASSYFVERGAEVIIADSPGGLYRPRLLQKIYDETGMTEAAKRSGATLNLHTESVKEGEFTRILPLVEADLIVNLARMKTHMLCNMTAAVKNLFGSIPGTKKAEYHAKYPDKKDFCDMLVRLCKANAPAVNIIDGVTAMEGDGPAGGTLRRVGVVIGSANPFAADLLCAFMMGFSDEEVQTVSAAKREGLCPDAIEGLEIIGADPKKYAYNTKRPKASRDAGLLKLLPRTFAARLKKERKPVILERKCVGCGECVRACPAETMEIVDKKALIHRENCIKCFCCQELCPQKAVVVR